MNMTLSMPDTVAHRFQAAVPVCQQSGFVARLIENELTRRDGSLAAACLAANRDEAPQREIDEWQSFDDGTGE
uniref:Uncharacterized protein n=1 Tax=Candidatus Kentrum sp. TC TaxID=2126339 RepID=A0A450YFF2_9GAMM|nr:MAG: hypothetical protein BECKTC1821D_GA0114238_100925 [Candidatus Kentron sp. TC]